MKLNRAASGALIVASCAAGVFACDDDTGREPGREPGTGCPFGGGTTVTPRTVDDGDCTDDGTATGGGKNPLDRDGGVAPTRE